VSVAAPVADVLRQTSVPAAPCDGTSTSLSGAGDHVVRGSSSSGFAVTSVALLGPARTSPAPVPVSVSAWAPESRDFTIPAGTETVVALGEGFNAGWTASLDGVPLAPVRLDGWRQAWRVPASSGPRTVSAMYAPGTTQRVALAVGGLLMLVVLAVALVPGRSGLVPVSAGRGRTSEPGVLTVLVPALVASWAGLLVGIVALVARRTSPTVRTVVAVGCLVGSGLVAAAFSAPWGTSVASGAAQLLAVVAVALVAVSGVDDPVSAGAAAEPSEGRALDDEPRREGDGEAAEQGQ
jgi:arabinofuranan 3-O-arabinosyltransferase